MEDVKIAKFLSEYSGYGSGYGSGAGTGYGSGYGTGSGSGYGSGSGDGSGDGYCDGYGGGYGTGSGSGFGDGYGSGYGYDVKNINGLKIYHIDGVATIIKSIKRNIARGYTLQSDLTLKSCYVAKVDDCFAHAENIKTAVKEASDKVFQLLPEEERIKKFWECHNLKDKYLARDLWVWHNKLTGSCEMGRNRFAKERDIDLDKDYFTVLEFYEMCKNSYGGDIIKKLI